MKRARQWLIGGGIALGVLGLGAVVAVKMIPSDEELKVRAAAELEAALGVPVSVGALHWQLLPSPRVTVENVVTTQTQPIEVKKLTAYLDTSALWKRRLKVARAELDGGVVPQLSLRGLNRGWRYTPLHSCGSVAGVCTVGPPRLRVSASSAS